MVVNPPLGERMGHADALPYLYNTLGELMSRQFDRWRGVILTSDLSLGKAVGLRADKRHRFHNGRLDLHCLQFDLGADNRFRPLQGFADTESAQAEGEALLSRIGFEKICGASNPG
jgi:23S rRNA (guanine2445-N2)-methyltransferase / 23S rRNA (guanine2069-N7)-methyltransferase